MSAVPAARNQHRCPTCGTDTLKRVETATRNRPATRGTVVALRVFRCLQCRVVFRTIEVSLGESAKAYVRDRSDARGTAGYETDDSSLVDLARRPAGPPRPGN